MCILQCLMAFFKDNFQFVFWMTICLESDESFVMFIINIPEALAVGFGEVEAINSTATIEVEMPLSHGFRKKANGLEAIKEKQ